MIGGVPHEKRTIWIIAIVVVLILALGIAGYATDGFGLVPLHWIDGSGNVTVEWVEEGEYSEDNYEPGDGAIELPEQKFYNEG